MSAHTVLLVEDAPDDIYLRRLQIEAIGHECHVELDLASGLAAIAEDPKRFDLILLDIGLPDVLEPLSAVRAMVATDVPVVVLTNRNDAELAIASLEAGAARYIVKQRFDEERLAETIEAVVSAPAQGRGSLLVGHGFDELRDDVADALASLRDFSGVPDWVVGLGNVRQSSGVSDRLRSTLGLADEAEVVAALTSAGWHAADLALFGMLTGDALVTAAEPRTSVLTGLAGLVVEPIADPPVGVLVGAAVSLDGEVDLALVKRTARSLQRGVDRERARIDAVARADAAVTAAQTDSLTGLLNRRALDRVLVREQLRVMRSGDEDVLVVIDLDELKKVNDQQGHGAGDELIRTAAQAIESAIRGSDQAFRTGGDEFVVLAPLCEAGGGVVLAERIRAALRDAGVGASLGHAARGPEGELTETLERADAAMYEDKERKRG